MHIIKKMEIVDRTYNLDQLGRITIPAYLRRELGWGFNTELQVYNTKDGVYITKKRGIYVEE